MNQKAEWIKTIAEIVQGIRKEDLKGKKCVSLPVEVKTREKLKPKQIENALTRFAKGCDPEDIAVLCDMTILSSGKKGVLFSAEGFYSDELNNYKKKERQITMPICYRDLMRVEMAGASGDITFTYKNGGSVTGYASIYAAFLVEALRRIMAALPKEKPAKKASVKESAQTEASPKKDDKKTGAGEAALSERQKAILQMMRDEPSVRTEEIAECFGRANSTIQKDIQAIKKTVDVSYDKKENKWIFHE